MNGENVSRVAASRVDERDREVGAGAEGADPVPRRIQVAALYFGRVDTRPVGIRWSAAFSMTAAMA